MDQALHYLQIFLLLNLLPGLLRIARGPSNTDRLLAIQLSSTTGVALLLVMSHTMGMPVLRNVALVLALLATPTIVAFTRLLSVRMPEEES